MSKRIYPKVRLAFGLYPLITFAAVTFIYLIVGSVLNYINVLPLNIELMINYHVITFCLPTSLVIGIYIWSNKRITVKNNMIYVSPEMVNVKRKTIKMGDIIEICANEPELGTTYSKFHFHLKDENVEIIENIYDQQQLLLLAKQIKLANPNIKLNKTLEQVMN